MNPAPERARPNGAIAAALPADAVEATVAVGPVAAGPVVAIVAAFNRADTVEATVRALLGTEAIDRVVVVDDGSRDGTADLAAAAGARVHRLERNVGKGGAVSHGVAEETDAAIYVLIDADLGSSADIAGALVGPVLASTADMAIGAPVTAARGRGGFGSVKRLAAAGIKRACGFAAAAPLSGQRAVRGDLMRSIALAPRFGLETALTIDAVRAGGRVEEIPTAFEHRHTGRSIAGFTHRARQGGDIMRALWPRLTTAAWRRRLIVTAAVLALVCGLGLSQRAEPSSVAPIGDAAKVVVFGIPRVGLDDIGAATMPHLDRFARDGALAATSVRTLSSRTSTVEGYATLGTGARVRGRDPAGDAYGVNEQLEGATAGTVLQGRTGKVPGGEIVVVGAPATIRLNTRKFIPALPGGLGDALHRAKKRTAVVGNTDIGNVDSDLGAAVQRPAAVAVMDSDGNVDTGQVGASLLRADPGAPFGLRVDEDVFVAAAARAIAAADVIVLDPGELDRAAIFRGVSTDEQAETARLAAHARTDRILARVRAALPPRTLLIVSAVRPPTSRWELTPTVFVGEGVRTGYLHSPSTRRLGLVTLTDLAPTILDRLGVAIPSGMIGHPLRYHPGTADVLRLRDMNDLAGYRERIYLPLTKGYVTFQAILYALTIFWFGARGGVGRAAGALRHAVLGIAALPLATFVFRAIPRAWRLDEAGIPTVLLITAAIVVLVRRAHRHPLSPLAWILGLTVALVVIDVFTGARLQQSSILGYSPHTAARFLGLGNAAFAVLAATTTLWAAIHVQFAPRRSEALISALMVCLLVVVVDGAPSLGSDVGGILTLVPVFGLLMAVLSGRRISARAVGVAGLATGAVLVLATLADLARPADERTHLGRFAASVFGDDGQSTFATTVGRKLSTNIRVFTGSFWTWVVPIIAILLLVLLVWQRGWERHLPPGSALRAGVIAALVAGLLGFAVNDSGTVVTALIFVYLGPLVTLLALQPAVSRASSGP